MEKRWRWGFGPVVGLAAAGFGLGVAEVAAGLMPAAQSPVLDVGDRVVDGVPNSVKELAIEWFGTNDKAALLVGIGVLLGVYAAVLGVLALGRRWWLGLVGAAGFGLVGAYASQSTRRAVPWYGVVPSLLGAATAAVALWCLHRAAFRTAAGSDTDVVPTDPPTGAPDRRTLLFATGIAAALGALAATFGRRLEGRSGVGQQRSALALPAADTPRPPVPADVRVDVDGVEPFFTPNDDFYRIDTALTVPQVSVDGWRLRIGGMVDRPLELTFDELASRRLVEADITLTCVSNEIGGGLLGTARWLGVRLDDLLADVAPHDDADQVVGRSVDGYTCGFPVATLDGRDALVAIGMNGEPLPVEHGYPARLIVPGLYGYVSATKWLAEIELTRFDRFDQYWVDRGWVENAPIKTQSRIDTPRGLARLAPGTVAVAGSAWAQTRGIERVELSIDNGDWQPANLAAALNDVTWRQWSFAWDATSGRHTITVRATDGTGAIQTADRTEPFPSGATGQHQIVVLVE